MDTLWVDIIRTASVQIHLASISRLFYIDCGICRMCSQTQLASISRSRLFIYISSIVQMRCVGDSCWGGLIIVGDSCWGGLIIMGLIDPVQMGYR